MRQYENYITKVTCWNCRRQMRIKIPVEIKVTNFPCPHCKTKELMSGYLTWQGG